MNNRLKTLLLTTLCICAACGSGSDSEPGLQNTVIDGLRYHFSYNGQIERLAENSWIFTSHTNNACRNRTTDGCRKIDINYSDNSYNSEDVFVHSFDLELRRINIQDPPEFIIVFQDWVRIYPDDEDGNRPITTLKIEQQGGQFYLRQYDNSWQWESPPLVGNPASAPENRLNGEYPIDAGVSYNVALEIHDAGRVVFYVDDQKISDVEYKTKSETESHAIQWGMYWERGYNPNHDVNSQIEIQISNFNLP